MSNVIYIDDYWDDEPRITEDNPLTRGMTEEEQRQAALRLIAIVKNREDVTDG